MSVSVMSTVWSASVAKISWLPVAVTSVGISLQTSKVTSKSRVVELTLLSFQALMYRVEGATPPAKLNQALTAGKMLVTVSRVFIGESSREVSVAVLWVVLPASE